MDFNHYGRKMKHWLIAALVGVLLAPGVADAGAGHVVEARSLLADLVAIPSTQETGRAREAAELLANVLLNSGFPPEDVQSIGPSASVGGLVARLPGRSGARPVLLMAHLDVLPAETAAWATDPFTLTERDGFLYGRGVDDNKSGAALLVVNLVRLRNEGFVPANDLYLVFTLDEETQMESIRWLLAEVPQLRTAQAALTSDSSSLFKVDGKPVIFGVQAAEKIYMTLDLEVTGEGGHSAWPHGENTIYVLAEALRKLAGYRFPVSLGEVTRGYFAEASRLEEGPLGEAMLALAGGDASQEQMGLLQSSPYHNAMMRTTCVATRLAAGNADNAVPQSAIATVNCRILPHEDPDETIRSLEALIGDPRVMMHMRWPPDAAPPTPLRPDVLERIEKVVTSLYPGIRLMPIMSAGATDALYTRAAGIDTYGLSGLVVFPEENYPHAPNERIAVEYFEIEAELWYRLLKRF